MANNMELLETLWAEKNFSKVIQTANISDEVELLSNPEILSKVAMSQYFTGSSGQKNLSIARSRGSIEAKIWQAVVDFFQVSQSKNLDIETFFYQYRYEQLRRSYNMDFPTEVHIETQTLCNASCTFCPYPSLERKGEKMSDTLIDKIIEDLKEIPKDVKFFVSPFKVSDPFLDKRIFKVIKKINQTLPHAGIRLFTNGSALTDTNLEMCRDIKNLNNLWISLNDVNEVRYQKLMGIKLDKVLKNLDNLHSKKEKDYPHEVVVSRVADQTKADEEFLTFTKERYPLFKSILAKRSDWIGTVNEENLSEVPNLGCLRWFEVSIMSNGKVSLCCMDGHGDHSIGDVNESSVLEIYNSDAYKSMRLMANTRKVVKTPCDTCNL